MVFSGGGGVVGAVSIAVAAGLLLGKFIGIFLFTWLAVKSGLSSMPPGMNWRSVAGVSLLGVLVLRYLYLLPTFLLQENIRIC